MRPTVLVTLIFAVLSLARTGYAQGCQAAYTFKYTAYTSASSDGTNIYTTVVTDGSAVSNGTTEYCNYPNARHTASAYNKLGSTGGWSYGTPGTMTSYLYVRNDQQIAAQPGVIYQFNAEGQVICSALGSLLFVPWIYDVEIAFTKSATNFSDPGTISGKSSVATCKQVSHCTPSTTPPACAPTTIVDYSLSPSNVVSCSPYFDSLWFAEWIYGKTNPSCFPLVPGLNAEPTSDASLGVCTPNPGPLF